LPRGVFPNGNSGFFKKGESQGLGKKMSDETKKKISDAKKGKPCKWTSERNRKFKGKLHPNYKGWDCRSITGSVLYLEIISKPCKDCGNKAELIHHKDRNRKNNKRENLVPLCYSCHAKVHNKLSNFGDKLFRKGSKKPLKTEVVK